MIRALTAVGDQLLSSLSSLIVSIALARSLGAADFGVFSTIYLASTFAVGLGRARWSEPAVIMLRGQPAEAVRRLSLVAPRRWEQVWICALPLAAASQLTAGPVSVALVAVGLTASLGVVDAHRYRFFSARRPARALTLSSTLLGLNIVAVTVRRPATVFESLTLLLISTMAVSLLAMLWCGVSRGSSARWLPCGVVPPRISGAEREQLRFHGRNYALEYLAGSGGYFGGNLVVLAILGPVSSGAIRGCELLMAPLRLLATVLPVAVVSQSNLRTFTMRTAAMLGAALAVMSVGYVSLVIAGEPWLTTLLGATAEGASRILPVYAVGVAVSTVSAAAVVGMRHQAASRRSMWVRTASGLLILSLVPLGCWWGGTRGAAVAFAVSSIMMCGVWWVAFARGERR